MKTPICSICLQSDILCARCRKNVETGRISGLGAKVIKNLYALSKTTRSLDNVVIEKVVDLDSLILILCQKTDVANMVGREGRITKELRKNFGKQVKIVGREDYKGMISSLMFPARVSIGKLYSNGMESIKITMQKSQLKSLPAKQEDLLTAITEITNMKTELSVQ
ncbi:MAG: hypothetical protein HYS53_02800 [Candidatus Aenigmarchaeota archaeon]|nr:hypothetical protein [Candidatus Aenigmarchaeota archaeon]